MSLSNTNLARGHKEVRRSTGHIMVTTRYSNQQGSKSRQNPCQVQPPENIGNLSVSRRCLWVKTTVSTVWIAVSISVVAEIQATEKTVSCAAHSRKSSKVIQNVFLALGGLHGDKLCDTLQAMAPTNVKTVPSLLHIESNLDRLQLLLSTNT